MNWPFYVGSPPTRYHHLPGKKEEPNTFKEEIPPRHILCIFVSKERKFIARHWCNPSHEDPELPEAYETRYEGRIR